MREAREVEGLQRPEVLLELPVGDVVALVVQARVEPLVRLEHDDRTARRGRGEQPVDQVQDARVHVAKLVHVVDLVRGASSLIRVQVVPIRREHERPVRDEQMGEYERLPLEL